MNRKTVSNWKNDIISCGCGCGESINKYDSRNRLRKYKENHFQLMRGKINTGAFKKGHSPANKGKKSKYPVWNKGMVGYNSNEDHYNWKGGKPKCLVCGKEIVYSATKCKPCSFKDKDYRKMGLKGVISQSKGKITSIEKIVYDFLEEKNIIFEKQKLINNRFLVDTYIPKHNLIIECDGDYWHNLEHIKTKDRKENAYLRKCGFNLLRLSEKEINNQLFIKKIQEVTQSG